MNQSKKITYDIEHYTGQLQKSYSLIKFLNQVLLEEGNKTIIEELKISCSQIKYTCFIISNFLDVATSLKGLINSKSYWEKLFYIKNGFLTTCESIKTYYKYQKEFSHLIDSRYNELKAEYLLINQNLKEFKKKYKYDSEILTFRNKVAAHYDKDFEKYFDEIQKLEIDNAVKLISEFSNFLMQVISFCDKMLEIEINKIKNQ